MTQARRLGTAERIGVSAGAAVLVHAALFALLELAVRVDWPQPVTYLGSVTVDLGEPPVEVLPRAASAPEPSPRPTPPDPEVPAVHQPERIAPTTQPPTVAPTPRVPDQPAVQTTSPRPAASTTTTPAEPWLPDWARPAAAPEAPGTDSPADQPSASTQSGAGTTTDSVTVRGGAIPGAGTPGATGGEVTQTPEDIARALLGSRPAGATPTTTSGGGSQVAGDTTRAASGTEVSRAAGGDSTLVDQVLRQQPPSGGAADSGAPAGASPAGAAPGDGTGPGVQDGRVAWARGAPTRGLTALVEPELQGITVSARMVVEVRILVASSGVVTRSDLVRRATPEIERAVLEAVRQWLFLPAPGAAMTEATVTFTFEPRR